MKMYVRDGSVAQGGNETISRRCFGSAWACWVVWLLGLVLLQTSYGQAPGVVSHFGFVQVGGVPFTGAGQFKAALVDGTGATTFWSHDGTSVAGSEPLSSFNTNLVNGRYSFGLGDTSIANVTQSIPASVFANTGVYLRLWFSNGVHGFQQLIPDQSMVSVPYALHAAKVANDAIESAQIADGNVKSDDIQDGGVATVDLAPDAVTTDKILDGTITSADIANGSILSLDIADGAILTADIADGAVTSADVLNETLTASDIATGAVASAEILDNSVTGADVLDGTLTTADFNLANIDVRYVLKAGDTMTGNLTLPKLTASTGIVTTSITNLGGILSLVSRTDIELMIDNGGGANAAFEIFNGSGNHIFSVTEVGAARSYGNHTIDGSLTVAGTLGIGTLVLDANAVMQIDLPDSDFGPHLRLKSSLGNNGFGLQFVNPDERWFVGPNIGNWPDDRFNIMADSSNKGLIIAANGNVGIDSVSAATPFTTLTVDGTIGFPTVTTPAMYIYPSGTSNADKPVIMHSPAFPGYGLYYVDAGDWFVFRSSASDITPSLVVDVDNNWVSIGTTVPKPGYELSVDGQIVCEELLVENSADWPDYVFDENYPLKSLEEVEAHIKERKHLPGIPTAEEVAKNGISVGKMQKSLMEKIEELTLHLIQQNKRMAEQEARIQQLEAKLVQAGASAEAAR